MRETVKRIIEHYKDDSIADLEAALADARKDVRSREEGGLKPRVHTVKRIQALKFVMASRLAPERTSE